MSTPRSEKERAREQWTHDPAGAAYGRDHDFATREFFESVERHRYQVYAPWMPAVMEFDKFAGKTLLEVGCGLGTDLLQFARGGAQVVGIDLTPRSIELTQKHFALYSQHGDFAIADAEHLPFASESFDIIYSNGVLHHTPDTEKAVNEIHRVLRPSGLARVMLYHRHSWNYWFEIIAHRGLLRGQLLRGQRADQIMSRYVEVNDGGGRPLVKVYSRKEVRALFSSFSDVKIEIEQLSREEFYGLGRLIPDSILERWSRRIGWNLVVTAIK